MECKIPDYAGMWQAHVQASCAPRMKDDRVEEQFWEKFIETKVYDPDPTSRRVLQYLMPIFRAYDIETALELGPGWGNYTLDLAKFCKSVTCVDISQAVLDFINRVSHKQGLSNIHGIHRKWEDFFSEKSHDLVFGYNCFYRQADLRDCFERMNRTARKLCVAGMTTGLLPRWVSELEAAGGRAQWDFKDYIYFSGVLYQMGILANVQVLRYEKTIHYQTLEKLVTGELQRCSVEGVDRQTAEEILTQYFARQSDGSWQGTAEFHSGIVWWEPQPIREPEEMERFLRT